MQRQKTEQREIKVQFSTIWGAEKKVVSHQRKKLLTDLLLRLVLVSIHILQRLRLAKISIYLLVPFRDDAEETAKTLGCHQLLSL